MTAPVTTKHGKSMPNPPSVYPGRGDWMAKRTGIRVTPGQLWERVAEAAEAQR